MQKIILVFFVCFLVAPTIGEEKKTTDWGKLLNNALKKIKYVLKSFGNLLPQPEDVGKNISQILKTYDYPCDEHIITTDDGYKLKVFNIPHGRNNKSAVKSNKPVVFLMHCVMCSAVDYVNQGPNNSLGFILADQGFDVWLGNSRGNMYGRSHVTLDPDKDASFWNFSWHEQGVFDLPATIDYVLNQTHASNLTYIGHSQGTADFFVMGSERPEYNKKINVGVMLAPVAFLQNSTSPFAWLLANDVIRNIATDVLHIYEIPYTDWTYLLGKVFCNRNAPTQFLCFYFLQMVVGFDTQQFDTTLLPVFLTNNPAGVSIKQLVHFGQIVKTGYFRKFDYGQDGNIAKYQSPTPPNYNLNEIICPVALYYGQNDSMVVEYNVAQLADKLPNLVANESIKDFNHLDFIWASTARTKVYEKVFKLIRKYTG